MSKYLKTPTPVLTSFTNQIYCSAQLKVEWKNTTTKLFKKRQNAMEMILNGP